MLDLFKKITDMLKGVDICEKCESSKKTTEKVMNLTPEEMEEWASIRAETHRIDKVIERLSQEQMILKSRRSIFWGKINLKCDNSSGESHFIIDKDAIVKVCCGECSSIPGQMPGPGPGSYGPNF